MKRETHDCFTLALDTPEGGFPFRPGQFNMMYTFGHGEVPISISGDPSKPERLVHTIRAVGGDARPRPARGGRQRRHPRPLRQRLAPRGGRASRPRRRRRWLGQSPAGDDGAGPAVIAALRGTTLSEGTTLGLAREPSALIPTFVEARDRVILVDAIVSAGRLGQVAVYRRRSSTPRRRAACRAMAWA